jgi:hypothetical protein
MSGSNALAAAKRRRGGSLPDNRPIQRSVQPQSSVSSQVVPAQSVSSVPAPPGWALPANVSPLQIITVHHTEIGRMMVEFPETFEELGNSFNSLSANYDNLHGRVVELETNASVDAFKELDAKVKSEIDRSADAMATLKVSTFEMQKNTIENGNRLTLINDAITDFKTRLGAYDALFNDVTSKLAMKSEPVASDALFNDLTSKLAMMTERVGAYDALFNDLTSKLAMMTDRVAASDALVNDVTSKLAMMTDRAAASDALVNDVTSKLAMITEGSVSMSSSISSLEQEVSRLASMTSVSASVSEETVVEPEMVSQESMIEAPVETEPENVEVVAE